MIGPTATDILCSIETCFETIIRPALTGSAERSAAATMGHLLRHLRLRLEAERGIEAGDALRQGPLLARLDDYFTSIDDGAGRAGIAATRIEGGGERRLQLGLETSLRRLVTLRSTHGDTPAYLALRAELRAEMAEQLRGEAALIHPAFAGHGPRR